MRSQIVLPLLGLASLLGCASRSAQPAPASGGAQQDYQALGEQILKNTTEKPATRETGLGAVQESMKASCTFASGATSTAGTINVEVVTASCSGTSIVVTVTHTPDKSTLKYHCSRMEGQTVVAVAMAECQGVVEPHLGNLSGGAVTSTSTRGGGGGPAAPTGGACTKDLECPGEQICENGVCTDA